MKTKEQKTTSKGTLKTQKKSSKKNVKDDAIRHRAYQIYLETGSIDEHANWVQAENELREK